MRVVYLKAICAASVVFSPGFSYAEGRFIPITFSDEPNAYLTSTILYPPGTPGDKIENYYTICASDMEHAKEYAQKALEHQNYEPFEDDLANPQSSYTEEFIEKMKNPDAKAAYIAEQKKQGYFREYELVTIRETKDRYEIVSRDKENNEEGQELLYKCSAFEQAKHLPKGYDTVGESFKGVIGKTVLGKDDPAADALEFVKSEATSSMLHRGLYNTQVLTSPGKVTITYKQALVSTQDWNIPAVIYYLNNKFVFDLKTNEIYAEQKQYAIGEGEVDESLLK